MSCKEVWILNSEGSLEGFKKGSEEDKSELSKEPRASCVGKDSEECHIFIRETTSKQPSTWLLYKTEVDGRAGSAGVEPILRNLTEGGKSYTSTKEGPGNQI